jgi:ribosomal-protein-serine acetyltransferase
MYNIILWHEGHIDSLAEAIVESKESLEMFHCWNDYTYDREGAAKWVRDCQRAFDKKTYFGFAIEDEGGKLVGSISLYCIEKHANSCRMGYWVRTSRQREGAATYAGTLASEYAFNQLGFTRVELIIDPQNWSSRNTARSLGAFMEGLAHNKLFFDGEPHHAIVYGLTP